MNQLASGAQHTGTAEEGSKKEGNRSIYMKMQEYEQDA